YNISTPLSFTLAGGPISITVAFQPLNRILWNETGLGPGLNWSVALDGVLVPDAGGWVTSHQFNGSYSFSIPGVQDYVPTPGQGILTLTGSGATVDVRFVRATFSVTFAVTGLPNGTEYQVRLSNSSESTTLELFGFEVPNGTYTFDIAPPAGYYSTPSHGTVNVTGHPTTVSISLLPNGRGPSPPLMALVISAATVAVALGLSGTGAFMVMGAIRRRTTGPFR
ncbi:MAG: hypothetical protein L3K02_04270, partial [Thermoplasmata archaeon]|nr:hypothetical protein [Thermoplasmata archaeon]